MNKNSTIHVRVNENVRANSARNIVRNSTKLHQKLDEAESDFKAWKDNHYRASLRTRLIKEKTDRYGSCKETFRRRAVALQGRLTKQMTCIAVFSQKGFLEMPYILQDFYMEK